MVIVSWFASRTIPWVPTIDFQELKNALKPILLYPEITAAGTLRHFTAWLLVAHLASKVHRISMGWIALAIVGTLLLQIPIVDRSLSVDQIVGAVLVLTIWSHLQYHHKRIHILLLLVLVTILLDKWHPYIVLDTPQTFHWVPFYGFMQGSLYINTLNVLEKFFWFGGLLWLLEEEHISWGKAFGFSLIWISMIEVGQIWLDDHIAEISDPIILIMIATWIKLYHKRNTRTNRHYIGWDRRYHHLQ